MNGLGGINKSAHGVVLGMVQLQLPVVATPDDLAAQTARIVAVVAKARRGMANTDLVVFPRIRPARAQHAHRPCADVPPRRAPEVAAFRQASVDNDIWGCFSIMEANPDGNPWNVGLVIDNTGEVKLYYRKLHPWCPAEPWEPGDLGIPVIDGPNGLSLIHISEPTRPY